MNDRTKGFLNGMALTIIFLFGVGVVFAGITSGGGMTTFSYTVTNAQAIELRDALCNHYHYQTQILNATGDLIANPESCDTFAWKRGKDFFTDHVISYRREQALLNISTGTSPSVN